MGTRKVKNTWLSYENDNRIFPGCDNNWYLMQNDFVWSEAWYPFIELFENI